MKNESLMNWYDKVVLLLAATVMLIYIWFVSGGFGGELENSLSNALFAVLNILVTVFFAYKISYFSAHSQNLLHQKKLARTSIRHIRGYLKSLFTLELIIEEKIEATDDELFKQYLLEFRNHTRNIKEGILSSENDFKDIVGEEFEEENSLIVQMSSELVEMKKKYDQIKQLQKEKREATAEEIDRLKEEIEQNRKGIQQDMIRLPFGEPFKVSSSGVSLPVFSGEDYQLLKPWTEPIKFPGIPDMPTSLQFEPGSGGGDDLDK